MKNNSISGFADISGCKAFEHLDKAVIITASDRQIVFEDAPQLSLTVSVGLASFEAGDDRNALIARADKCMYHAKISGRDRVVHTLPTGT